MFKDNNKDTTTTPMASFCCLIANFEHISHLALVFLLLTLSWQMPAGKWNNGSTMILWQSLRGQK